MSLRRRAAQQSSQQSLRSLTEAYAVFGMQEGASLLALRRTYHALALRHHPDKQGAASEPATFNRIKAAYELLLNSPLANLDRSTSIAASGIDAKAQAAFEELERQRHARELREQRVAEQQRRASDNARANHSAPALGELQAFRQYAFGSAPAVLFDNVVYTRTDVRVDGSLPPSSGRAGEDDLWVSAEDGAAHIRREYRSDMRCWAWVLTLATGAASYVRRVERRPTLTLTLTLTLSASAVLRLAAGCPPIVSRARLFQGRCHSHPNFCFCVRRLLRAPRGNRFGLARQVPTTLCRFGLQPYAVELVRAQQVRVGHLVAAPAGPAAGSYAAGVPQRPRAPN